MTNRARRAIAGFCVALSIANLSGCYRTRMESPRDVLSRGPSTTTRQIVAVTTRSGNFVPFDRTPRAVMANDSLFASVGGEGYRVALSDIEHVWIEHLDRGASALVVIGVGLSIYGLIYVFDSLGDLSGSF